MNHRFTKGCARFRTVCFTLDFFSTLSCVMYFLTDCDAYDHFTIQHWLNADTQNFSLEKEHKAAYTYICQHAHTELIVG